MALAVGRASTRSEFMIKRWHVQIDDLEDIQRPMVDVLGVSLQRQRRVSEESGHGRCNFSE